ncbi:uncharacterized protein si:dkey-192k22.2 isoform X2 [Acanthochromis polyacanthus]|uniref:uncharacterized protein si:dkey-192k22.2 isoform X2 n=1 Tax=Acanthochromis polyacanthus TaxID=80966 RepID=UPI000B8F643C|nr:uncharacterized protein si:dkey-192k22.2 isoform X2 [Acanthochromis polyacanthus]
MTRAAVTKLLVLVILAFIICLPEFFTLYRESKVNFLCLPYEPCEQGDQVKEEGEHGKTGNAEIKRKDVCDPSKTQWDQVCTQEDQSNATDSASDFRRGRDDPKTSWFLCDTDTDMTVLYGSNSSPAVKLHLEMSVELQLSDAESLNLTLYGRSNHSSLHLHPPEEEEDEQKGDNEGQKEAFYCCLPLLPTSQTANQSRCLLWLANQTVLTATAKEKLPWKRTQKEKPKVLPVVCNFTGHRLNGKQAKDGKKQAESMTLTSKATALHSYGFQGRPGLSTIEEADSQNDIEMLLDGNVEHCYTANLHHRGHPSTSSLTEDLAW